MKNFFDKILLILYINYGHSLGNAAIRTTIFFGNVKMEQGGSANLVVSGSDPGQGTLLQSEVIGNAKVILAISDILMLAEWQEALKHLMIKEMRLFVSTRNQSSIEEFQNNGDYPITLFHTGSSSNLFFGICPMSKATITTTELWRQGSICGDQLKGKHLTVSIIGLAPFVIYTPTGILGCDIDLLKIVSNRLGFTFSLKFEYYWFAMINGTAQGSFASVDRGESHIAIGTPTPDIYVNGPQVDVDTSTPLYSLEFIYVGPKPKPISPRWNFVKPYTLTTWIAIFGSIFIIIVFIALSGILDVFTIVALLFSQSTKFRQQTKISVSEYITTFACLLFVLIVTSSYECNLRAYLMVTDYEKVVDTAQDILDQGRHLYLAHGAGYAKQMTESPIEVYRKIAKQSLEGNFRYAFEAGFIPEKTDLEVEQQGDTILLTREMAYSQFAQMAKRRNGRLPYRVSKEVYTRVHVKFLFKKRLPWNPTLSLYFSWCHDSGLVGHHIRKYSNSKFRAEANIIKTSQPVAFRMEHVFGALICLISGLAVSFLAFLFEWIILRKGQKGGIHFMITELNVIKIQNHE